MGEEGVLNIMKSIKAGANAPSGPGGGNLKGKTNINVVDGSTNHYNK
jgi:hypothetical protein